MTLTIDRIDSVEILTLSVDGMTSWNIPVRSILIPVTVSCTVPVTLELMLKTASSKTVVR